MGDRAGATLLSLRKIQLCRNLFAVGALAAVALDIERDLRLCAATAVEDRLQDNVSDTLVSLMEADMKVTARFETESAFS